MASGTLGETAVGVESSAAASPSASSALPSSNLERAQRNGSQSSASSPATRIDGAASAATMIGTRPSGGAPSRSGLTSSRSSGRRSPSSSAFTATSVLRICSTGSLPLDPVEPLNQRRAAGAQAEREAPAGRPLQARRRHCDCRGTAAPDRQHGRGEVDPRGDSGDPGEQHHRIVSPPLGRAEAPVSELLGSDGEADRCLLVGLERRDPDTDPGRLRRGHAPNLSDPTGCAG